MEHIIIENSIENLASGDRSGYVAHVYGYDGSCHLSYNANRFVLERGDCMVIVTNKLLEEMTCSDDFVCKVIYVSFPFLNQCVPQNNYGIKGTLSLFLNPVLRLSPEESRRCEADFCQVEDRLNNSHRFHHDILISVAQTLFLDLYDFHARIYGENELSPQHASVMSRFLLLLEEGNFKEHREVSWYASELCVVPKYLSEVSNKVSGFSANYWISRFTAQEIKRLLRTKAYNLPQLADMFHFSSVAYMGRYVQRYLGTPLNDLIR